MDFLHFAILGSIGVLNRMKSDECRDICSDLRDIESNVTCGGKNIIKNLRFRGIEDKKLLQNGRI